jgi:hypothetical protein
MPHRYTYQYAAKFLCTSNIPGTSQTTTSVLPGNYATVINIHNPNERAVRMRMKLALTIPPDISDWREGELKPDQAVKVDCEDISRDFGITFIHGAEGFLVIESTRSLDVVAVYTAGPQEVASIDVEQVRERRMR